MRCRMFVSDDKLTKQPKIMCTMMKQRQFFSIILIKLLLYVDQLIRKSKMVI